MEGVVPDIEGQRMQRLAKPDGRQQRHRSRLVKLWSLLRGRGAHATLVSAQHQCGHQSKRAPVATPL